MHHQIMRRSEQTKDWAWWLGPFGKEFSKRRPVSRSTGCIVACLTSSISQIKMNTILILFVHRQSETGKRHSCWQRLITNSIGYTTPRVTPKHNSCGRHLRQCFCCKFYNKPPLVVPLRHLNPSLYLTWTMSEVDEKVRLQPQVSSVHTWSTFLMAQTIVCWHCIFDPSPIPTGGSHVPRRN
jgi:hypothetical protein